MKTLLSLLMRLFPRPWRNRYEEEFRAMFDDARFGCTDYIDVVSLALEVRMSGLSGVPAWKVVVVMAATGALVGTGAAVVWPSSYQSSAVMRVVAKGGDRVVSADPLLESAMDNAALERIMRTAGVLTSDGVGGDERVARFRRNLRIMTVGHERNSLVVQYVASKPELAQRITAALVDDVRRALPPSFAGEVIDPASLDRDPIAPNVRNVIVTGALAGALLGLLLAGLTTGARRSPPLRAA